MDGYSVDQLCEFIRDDLTCLAEQEMNIMAASLVQQLDEAADTRVAYVGIVRVLQDMNSVVQATRQYWNRVNTVVVSPEE